MPERVREAGRRLGTTLPKMLRRFYESGLFDWFARHAREPTRWTPIEKLAFHERTGALVVMQAGSLSPMHSIAVEELAVADPPIREYKVLGPCSKPPFKVVKGAACVPFSEMLIREVLMTASDVVRNKHHRLPLESGGPDAPRNVALRRELTLVPVNGMKDGTNWKFYEGPDLLYQESGEPREFSFYAILAGTSRTKIDEFAQRTFTSAPPKLRPTTFWSSPPQTSVASEGAFPTNRLQATRGEIYVTIDEYALQGCRRQLNWHVRLDFKPFRHAGFHFRPSAALSNIPWVMRDWKELDGRVVAGDSMLSLLDATLYASDHEPARRFYLELKRLRRDTFDVLLRMELNFRGFTDQDADPQMMVVGRAAARFAGLLIVPGNFKRTPVKTLSQVKALAASFVDLDCYKAPVKEKFRFRFPPKY